MPRWRALAPATLLVAAVAAPGTSARQDVPRQVVEAEIDVWISAVRQHVPGTLDEHDRAVAIWPGNRLNDVIAALQRRSSTDAPLLLRAASLYSDIAFFIPLRERPLYKATRGMLAHDGRPEGTSWLDSHLQVGQTLVRRAARQQSATAETREHASAWYAAVAAVLAGQLNLADLRPHLDEARQALPDDPAILFAAGCMAETFASPLVQATVSQQPPSRTSAIDQLHMLRYSRDANLRDAERDFRRAAELAPAMTEARVRLGRVLTLRGRAADAVAVLAQPSDAPEVDAVVRYYRALFLGRALEVTERPGDARAEYEKAAALFPRAQSPRIALARLAANAGETASAQQAIGVVLSLPREERARIDPWWDYYLGTGRNADSIYAAFSERIRQWSAPQGGSR